MADHTRTAQPADVFVIFGITGDLAKVMTFHSLYRLEKRGLLDCPIVGVASQNWTLQQLREHARDSIEKCGESIDDEVFGLLREAAGQDPDVHVLVMPPDAATEPTQTRSSQPSAAHSQIGRGVPQ